MKLQKIEALKAAFSNKPVNDLSQEFKDYACVALIISHWPDRPEVAFIRRAINPKDAWSGQIAFPGGRKDSSEEADLNAALREVKEEVGWLLNDSHHIGYLTDLQARNRGGFVPFFLRPLVFLIDEKPTHDQIDPEEVDEVFWVPLDHLLNPKNTSSYTFSQNQKNLTMPAIQLPTGDPLWGLTYFIILEFIKSIKQGEL